MPPRQESQSVDFFDQHLSNMLVAPSFEQGPPALPAGAGWQPECRGPQTFTLQAGESEASTQSSDGRQGFRQLSHTDRHHSTSSGDDVTGHGAASVPPGPPQHHRLPAPPPAAPAAQFDAMASMPAPPPAHGQQSAPQQQAPDPMSSYAPMPSHQAPSTANYRVGDEVEVWSNSHKRWGPGVVQKIEDGKVSVKYSSPDGAAMVKLMPESHKDLRHAATSSSGSQQQASRTDVYKAGDQIEIWSQSNNSWCRGTVEKLQGELVNVKYQNQNGQDMTKLMPNGHEFLRHFQQQHAVAPPPPPQRRSVEHGNDMPPPRAPMADSAVRMDSRDSLDVYQDACNGVHREPNGMMSSMQGGSPMASVQHGGTAPAAKGYKAANPKQATANATARGAQAGRDSNEVFVAESTSWVPAGGMMCGMPIKANKKQEVALNDDGTPVQRCPDTDRCCRCSMPIGSYFDHTCPRCEGVVCLNCLDDVKFITASYRCPSCGDQHFNREALKQNLWYMGVYRNAQRSVGAVPGLFAGLFGYGKEGKSHYASQDHEVEEPYPDVQPAPRVAAPKPKAQPAKGPPPAPPRPNGATAKAKALAAANPNSSACQGEPEHHTRPPAGWMEGAAGWLPGHQAAAPPDPAKVAAAIHKAAAAEASAKKPTGHAPRAQQGRSDTRPAPVLQAPNLFASVNNHAQRGANPLASANASGVFSTRIPPDQMSPMNR